MDEERRMNGLRDGRSAVSGAGGLCVAGKGTPGGMPATHPTPPPQEMVMGPIYIPNVEARRNLRDGSAAARLTLVRCQDKTWDMFFCIERFSAVAICRFH